MKLLKLKSLLSVTLLLLIFSCENETLDEPVNQDNLDGFVADELTVQETTLLIGKLLGKENVRNEVLTKMREADIEGSIVSFSYLLDVDNGLRKSEVEAIKEGQSTFKKSSSLFKQALVKEVINNSGDYSQISAMLSDKNIDDISSKSPDGDFAEQLSQLLADEEMQLFFPYEEESTSGKNDANDVFITYEPLEFAETNEAFRIVPNSSSGSTGTVLESIGQIDNDFLDLNPVFIVGFTDNCDIPGRDCGFQPIIPIGGGGPPGDDNCCDIELLKRNVNHADFLEADILSTKIPEFKVDGKDWLGFGATHQKLEIWRGSVSANIRVSNGRIVATGQSFLFGKFRFRRKGAKKGWWHKIDRNFDTDWNMTENEQQFAVFSKHKLRGSAKVELEAKVGAEVTDGQTIMASPNPTAAPTVTTEVESRGATLRLKFSLSRRQVLSTNVGNGLSQLTRTSNGINYNVKKEGIFHFYFNHFHTDLTP